MNAVGSTITVEETSATRAGQASVAPPGGWSRPQAQTRPGRTWPATSQRWRGSARRRRERDRVTDLQNERLSGDLHLECAVQDLHQLLRARLWPSLTCWSPTPKVQFHNSTTSGGLGAHQQHPPTTVLATPQHRILNMADHLQRLRCRRLDQAGTPTPNASLIFNRVPHARIRRTLLHLDHHDRPTSPAIA